MDLVELEARAAQLAHEAKSIGDDFRDHYPKLHDLEMANYGYLKEGETVERDLTGLNASILDAADEFPKATVQSLVAILNAREVHARLRARFDEATRRSDEARAVFNEARRRHLAEQIAEHQDGLVHWDRRFHTSLAIGNGAAFAAIVNHVFDKDTSQAAIRAAAPALILFALGLIVSGAIPWVRATRASGVVDTNKALRAAAKSRKRASGLARLAAALFVIGVVMSVGGVIVLGWPRLLPAPVQTKATNPVLPPATKQVPPPTSSPQPTHPAASQKG